MRIDLHTHSTASDGTDTPAGLVRAAADAGLDVVAITDHDTAEGWPAAVEAARDLPLRLVRGMEISTRHEGHGVHLLAYLPDPTYPPLLEELDRVLEGRSGRLPAMLEKLQGLGIAIDADDVARVSGGTVSTGRPHVADALVALGVVRDRTQAFQEYLNWGRPAHVDRYAAPLVETLRLVRAAGGLPVIAHPWGRSRWHQPDAEALEVLQGEGLAGLEVDHQDHSEEVRRELRGIAADLDLLVTGSSDYHGTGKVDHDLGCHTTSPEALERLLDEAAASARAAGRTTPEVVG